jgi:chemotaxis protein CheY-P-specific phosphatase CheC
MGDGFDICLVSLERLLKQIVAIGVGTAEVGDVEERSHACSPMSNVRAKLPAVAGQLEGGVRRHVSGA